MKKLYQACFNYHLAITIVGAIAPYIASAIGMWGDTQERPAFKVFMILAFWAMMTVCFLIGPLSGVAASVIVRFFAFVPYLKDPEIWGPWTLLLAMWAVFNIVTAFLGAKFDNDGEDHISMFGF